MRKSSAFVRDPAVLALSMVGVMLAVEYLFVQRFEHRAARRREAVA
jgi:hypothetical protein